MIKIELLREELTAAGLDYYWANLDAEGELNIRFLAEDGTKRMPTPEEQAIIDAVLAAHDPEGLTQAEQLRGHIVDIAQGAVGVLLTDLTAVQVRVLVACLLWKAGGVTQDGRVRALDEWLRGA
jgi:hypothetical protein